MNNTPIHRLLFLITGLTLVAIGMLGVILPVLPTTPFMILALWFFARSSERFHNWLYHHQIFGPLLQKWDQHQVIPPIAKMASVTAMATSMTYVVMFTSAPWYAIATMGIFVTYAAWFILSKPSRAPTI